MPTFVKCRAFAPILSFYILLVPVATTMRARADGDASPALDAASPSPDPLDASTMGQWAGPFAWPLVSVHTTLLPTGKVLLYDDHTDNAGVQVWDPVADTLVARPYVNEDLFCSGHTVMPDGRVLVVGRH